MCHTNLIVEVFPPRVAERVRDWMWVLPLLLWQLDNWSINWSIVEERLAEDGDLIDVGYRELGPINRSNTPCNVTWISQRRSRLGGGRRWWTQDYCSERRGRARFASSFERSSSQKKVDGKQTGRGKEKKLLNVLKLVHPTQGILLFYQEWSDAPRISRLQLAIVWKKFPRDSEWIIQ